MRNHLGALGSYFFQIFSCLSNRLVHLVETICDNNFEVIQLLVNQIIFVWFVCLFLDHLNIDENNLLPLTDVKHCGLRIIAVDCQQLSLPRLLIYFGQRWQLRISDRTLL